MGKGENNAHMHTIKGCRCLIHTEWECVRLQACTHTHTHTQWRGGLGTHTHTHTHTGEGVIMCTHTMKRCLGT